MAKGCLDNAVINIHDGVTQVVDQCLTYKINAKAYSSGFSQSKGRIEFNRISDVKCSIHSMANEIAILNLSSDMLYFRFTSKCSCDSIEHVIKPGEHIVIMNQEVIKLKFKVRYVADIFYSTIKYCYL